jgi:hypothetical protein
MSFCECIFVWNGLRRQNTGRKVECLLSANRYEKNGTRLSLLFSLFTGALRRVSNNIPKYALNCGFSWRSRSVRTGMQVLSAGS